MKHNIDTNNCLNCGKGRPDLQDMNLNVHLEILGKKPEC